MQRQQTLFPIMLDHLDYEWQEVVQVADRDVTSSKCGSRADLFLLGREFFDPLVEDFLLRGHVAGTYIQCHTPKVGVR